MYTGGSGHALQIPKKIAMINDIAGYGAALPPSDSHHQRHEGTGLSGTHLPFFQPHRFPVHFMHDCTPYLRDYLAKWKELGFRFDGIYCGFLGSAEQIGIVQEFLAGWPDVPFILDPVMGDHGKAYRTSRRSTAKD